MIIRAAIAFAAVAAFSRAAVAQLVPDDQWLTIETRHFYVHVPRGLESIGRRGAVDAERAFAELSRELKPPGGKVDLVIADNIDYVNGYATSFPGNRVVVFAHPPVDAPELRNYDDWLRLVITHELTHIFHLDRAEGLWRLGRSIFGRHPALFPNAYQPAWLIEGLAVYYESRITGAGRLEGPEHAMLARAAAEVNRVPRIGELSRSTSRFPGGEVVYAYGGLILDYLSRTRGPERIPQFIDKTSKLIWPVSLNARAKKAFGISFENAWRDWRDSLVRLSRHSDPLPGWRDLTREGRSVSYPRWLGDTAILYAAATGREVPSAYSVTLDREVRRVGRRNSLDVNVRRPDGSIYFTQPEYTDPFHFRNDLYVQRPDGRQQRLTRGARLTQIDVNGKGDIIAVQSVPASTILVRVSPDGKTITPLTVPSSGVQWAEPRWSPDGLSLVAVRILRGGESQIVSVRLADRAEKVLMRERAILASPSWSPSGDDILFTSSAGGTVQIWRASTGAPVTGASTGVFNPALSPDGSWIAALGFSYDGYHVGAAPASEASVSRPVTLHSARDDCDDCVLPPIAALPLDSGDVQPARTYSPWRSLVPTYWEPVVTRYGDDGFALGAATGGYDAIGRHSYSLQATYNTAFSEFEGYGAYQYAGLGQPFLNFSAEQSWEHFGVFDEAIERLGDLDRRARTVSVSASFSRPRARTFGSLAFGGDVESRSYSTDPDTLLVLLPERFGTTRNFPSVFAGASWTNTRRPGLSISREDGISLTATARQRWESGDFGNGSRSVVGVSALYKSLDLPGFAHHVIAFRGAGGLADSHSITAFSVGGLSGGSLPLLEGIDVGGERRTFGVRGFPPSAERGTRALALTLEYRAPIAAPSRRVPFVPVLFDRISLAPFAEAGRAFCPGGADETDVCDRGQGASPWLASMGFEIDLDTALQYDVPARLRTGLAVPIVGREAADARQASIYLTIGTTF